ncbi:type 1 glutamine amidotransferase [Pararhodobacter oceanensis]|uniref:type 1 glutamine amidotransferase n=1 Tax=Pararhodobacter oceanensis TaxID=2172121 RepID=UPI003A93D809
MKIGILQTGYAPDILLETGDYPQLFERLLAGQGFEFETFKVVDMEFPAAVTACDGWLITGSKHGVYEDHAFIPPLEDFIRDAFKAEVPVAGVCFGHQIMAQALGGQVEKFSEGWAIGATDYHFGDQTVRLNAWHQDQVIRPPEGAQTVGHSEFCRHAALSYGAKGYSVQPHPEFDADFISGLITHRGRGVVPDELLARASSRLDLPVDNAQIANQIAAFFKAARVAASSS